MLVAIVAHNYPPNTAVGGQRPWQWARWIGQKHKTVVITRYGKTNLREQPQRIVSGSSIISWAEKTFRSSRKKFFGPKKLGRPTGVFRYRMPCLYDLWIWPSLKALLKARPDLVICSHSPYANLLAGWLYKLLNPGSRLWIDYRDLWTGNHYYRGLPICKAIESFLEKKVIRSADIVTTVSQGYARALRKTRPRKRVLAILNAVEAKGEKARPAKKWKRKGPIIFAYTGSFYPQFQNPEPLFQWLRKIQFSEPAVFKRISVVIMPGDPLIKYGVSRHRLEDRFLFMDKGSSQESIDLQHQADFLLFLDWEDVNSSGVMPAKIFEYLLTQKPIVRVGGAAKSEAYQLLNKFHRVISLEEILPRLRHPRLLKQKAVHLHQQARQQVLDLVAP